MGYQLWTSPITGYRRHGTRLRDFDNVLGDRILVRDIFEPLQSCPVAAHTFEMAKLLQRRDFDVAGVKEERIGPVLGFVRATNLTRGVIGDHIEKISEEQLIEETMGIRDIFHKLMKERFLFVRVDHVVKGIVTQADLNKPLIRVYLFGLVSLLEIHLGYWVASLYPDLSWIRELSQDRVAVAQAFQAERERVGQALELIECLQFCDKKKLIAKSEVARQMLDLGSKSKSTRLLEAAEVLRNVLAHSQYDLTIGSSWDDLLRLVERIRAIILLSDDHVEARATQSATEDIGALW